MASIQSVVATEQTLIRDISRLLLTQGGILRAATGYQTTHGSSDQQFVRVYRLAAGGTVPSTSGKYYIMIEVDQTVLTNLEERAWGIKYQPGTIPS